MVQRSVCLCDGKYIGIESIFTVIDGKQINIPDKLSALRTRSRKGELFCPCGCGANLILVAGDRNLGGISTLDDIRALAAVGEGAIEGAITGRALYEGNFTLVQALTAARGEE